MKTIKSKTSFAVFFLLYKPLFYHHWNLWKLQQNFKLCFPKKRRLVKCHLKIEEISIIVVSKVSARCWNKTCPTGHKFCIPYIEPELNKKSNKQKIIELVCLISCGYIRFIFLKNLYKLFLLFFKLITLQYNRDTR